MEGLLVSVFYSSPKGLHIGQCQNYIVTSWGRDGDGYHCLAPVIGLGSEFTTDRDICGACQMKTQAFSANLMEVGVAGIVSDPYGAKCWIETTREQLTAMDRYLYRKASEGARMEELFKIKNDITRRERILEAVLTAAPDNVMEAVAPWDDEQD